jgi:secreted trypsin-like serine protease
MAAAVLCAATVASAGASTPAQTRIVGGQVAKAGTFPWLARVIDFRDDGLVGTCTGTVVSTNLILTAAHCVVDEETGEIAEPSQFSVVTGDVDWRSAERTVSTVSHVLVYPNYEPEGLKHWGDAALLQLTAPITAPPLKLASSAFWVAGTGAVIVGWGRTSYSQETLPDDLNWAEVVVQGKSYCESNAPNFHPLGQVCTIDAPDLTSGICNGDSGGPLLALLPGTEEVVVIGVSVVSYGECSTSKPSLATRSDLIDNWVNARIKELAPPPPAPAPTTTKPAPAAAAPVTLLPTMTQEQAFSYARTTLSEAFGSRFRGRHYYRMTCQRVEATKFKCGVNWTRLPNDYYGYVTVYLALENGRPVWLSKYTIRWVNDYCRYRSSYPGTCKVRLAKG